MSVEVGKVLEGKVVSIVPFGAFVSLPDGETGLVHISEDCGRVCAECFGLFKRKPDGQGQGHQC